MPVAFQYDLEHCNISDCQEKAESLLLCRRHEEQYVIDSKTRDYQAVVARRAHGTWSFWDRCRFASAWFRHASGKRIPLCEHFPLETLFLCNLADLKKKARLPTSDTDGGIVERSESLARDFAHRRNTLISRLQVVHSTLKDEGETGDYHDMTARIPGCVLPTPQQQAIHIAILAVLALVLNVLGPRLGIAVPLPYGLGAREFLFLLPILFGVGTFGSAHIAAVEKLALRPSSDPWFKLDEENADLRRRLKEAHARISEDDDKLAFATGILSSGVIATSATTTWSDSWISNGLAVALLLVSVLVLVPVLLTYPLFAETGLVSHAVANRHYRVDVYRTDKSLGVSDLKDVAIACLWYNVSLLALLVLYLPMIFFDSISPGWRTAYGVAIALPLLIRNQHVWLAGKALFQIRRATKTAIRNEKASLKDVDSFTDKRVRLEFLDEVESQTRRRTVRASWFFANTIVVPLLGLWASNHWPQLSEWFDKLLKWIQG